MRAAPTSSTSPRSSSAPARSRSRWSYSGIQSPADLEGRSESNWGFGNEFEVFAGLAQAGVDPGDVTHVAQGGDMIPLIEGQVDAAEAMTYNELALVLESVNPATGELFHPGT